MELRRRKKTSPELTEALAALAAVDRARSSSRRAKALIALRNARENLNAKAGEFDMAELTAPNWSSARADVLSQRLDTTIATLEGSKQ